MPWFPVTLHVSYLSFSSIFIDLSLATAASVNDLKYSQMYANCVYVVTYLGMDLVNISDIKKPSLVRSLPIGT
jgi:hypothetical protein